MCKPIYKGARAKAFLALFKDESLLRRIAELVYVEDKTYSEVADMVGYSERHISRLCKKIRQRATESKVSE